MIQHRDCALEVLLVCNSLAQKIELERKLFETPLFSLAHVSYDLSDAFNFAEHAVPDVVVSAVGFAKQREFEVFSALLAAIGTTNTIVTFDSSARSENFWTGQSLYSLVERENFVANLFTVHETQKCVGNTARVAPSRLSRQAEFVLDRFILIGASTGGVDALLLLLSACPARSPPILIVQHTGPGFATSLARLLDQNTALTVKIAEDGERLRSGIAYLAPSDDSHLSVSVSTPLKCRLRKTDPQSGHRPSVDVLFSSAVPHAHLVSAAILTGMGRDGAEGLFALRKAGARTFAQDRATSIIYGMPLAAIRLGAAEKEVAIDVMARNLLETSLRHST